MAKGDHIRAKRRGYWHHGVDCGHGAVIHYSGVREEKRDALVRRTSLAEFAKGGSVEVVKHAGAVEPDVAVRNAESRLGERRYSLFRNNCEHFARWCVTGKGRSAQVSRVVKVASGAAVGLAGMLIWRRRRRG